MFRYRVASQTQGKGNRIADKPPLQVLGASAEGGPDSSLDQSGVSPKSRNSQYPLVSWSPQGAANRGC